SSRAGGTDARSSARSARRRRRADGRGLAQRDAAVVRGPLAPRDRLVGGHVGRWRCVRRRHSVEPLARRAALTGTSRAAMLTAAARPVWKFGTPEGAQRAEDALLALQKQELVQVQDAAVVSWEEGRKKPRTRQGTSTTAVGALGGTVWGLLFGLLFFVPLLGAAIGAASGAIAGALKIGRASCRKEGRARG